MLPVPASSWSSTQLRFYNIVLQEVSFQTFYGINSLPVNNIPDMSYLALSAIAPTELGNEGTVNMLTIRLLDDAMLTAPTSYASLHPDLYFDMGYNPRTAGKPDVAVYKNRRTIMVVMENKRTGFITTSILRTVMAQLVAEAIAAQTFNRLHADPLAPIRVSTSFIHPFFISPIRLPKQPIFGVVTHGSAPFFVRVPVTNALRMAVRNPHRTPGLPQTIVTYCIPSVPGCHQHTYLMMGLRGSPAARLAVRQHYIAFMRLVRRVYSLD